MKSSSQLRSSVHIVWRWVALGHGRRGWLVSVTVLWGLFAGTFWHVPVRAADGETGADSGGAVLRVEGSTYFHISRFRRSARINCNRGYRFHEIPAFLQGLNFVSHQHKTPAKLTCVAEQGGTIYLCLGEGGKPDGTEGAGLGWETVAMMKGDDSGSQRPWEVFKARVEKGATFSVASPNKWGAVLAAEKIVGPKLVPEELAWQREYRFLQQQLSRRPDRKRQALLRTQTLHPSALLHDSDRDPLDILIRRTGALNDDLARMKREKASSFAGQLTELLERAGKVPVSKEKERRELFKGLSALRRKIAFSNPLLTFDKIVFLTHSKSRMMSGSNHMCDQYFGFNATPEGGVCILSDAFSDAPRATCLTDGKVGPEGSKLNDGSFVSLELSYDVSTLLFAWTAGEPDFREWKPDTCYHIFRLNVDGTGFTQLTDGCWNDFDPCYLPNGRIAFVSERRGGYGRCHGRPVPTYTLHSMLTDGSDILPISLHETNEWHPSVNNDGMIVYTRWDYVDRDSDVAHHLWVCFPDGRDPRSYHGNYPVDRRSRPWMEMSIRAIPNSDRYIAVAAPHHGQAYGSLVLIDLKPEDDGSMSQIRRISPECAFPEAERGSLMFGTPWPLSETYYLAVFAWDAQHYGIYLVDAFGNRVLVYEDPEIPCLDPIPLVPRPVPPEIPSMTEQRSRPPAEKPSGVGRVAVMNIYTADSEWPKDTVIRALRVVQLFPKATPSSNQPNIGVGAQSLARGVLGTVPVEADGSAYFEMPAEVPVYFQALDEKGQAVQGMRSNTFVHEGELLSCIGCHEPKREAAAYDREKLPLAIQREPSRIESEFAEAFPLTFPRLVQPVLDEYCVGCHSRQKKAPDLSGTKTVGSGWTPGFAVLHKFAWAKHGGNGAIRKNGGSRSIPGKVGAKDSRLLKMLMDGHHDVHLDAQSLRRITLWLDTNSNFYGAYRETEAQAKGEVVMPRIW